MTKKAFLALQDPQFMADNDMDVFVCNGPCDYGKDCKGWHVSPRILTPEELAAKQSLIDPVADATAGGI